MKTIYNMRMYDLNKCKMEYMNNLGGISSKSEQVISTLSFVKRELFKGGIYLYMLASSKKDQNSNAYVYVNDIVSFERNDVNVKGIVIYDDDKFQVELFGGMRVDLASIDRCAVIGNIFSLQQDCEPELALKCVDKYIDPEFRFTSTLRERMLTLIFGMIKEYYPEDALNVCRELVKSIKSCDNFRSFSKHIIICSDKIGCRDIVLRGIEIICYQPSRVPEIADKEFSKFVSEIGFTVKPAGEVYPTVYRNEEAEERMTMFMPDMFEILTEEQQKKSSRKRNMREIGAF